jgi:hypothetical protein
LWLFLFFIFIYKETKNEKSKNVQMPKNLEEIMKKMYMTFCVLILAGFITSCFSLPEEKPVEANQPEKRKVEVYNNIFEATRDINSRLCRKLVNPGFPIG